jgi:hypothetical protein
MRIAREIHVCKPLNIAKIDQLTKPEVLSELSTAVSMMEK